MKSYVKIADTSALSRKEWLKVRKGGIGGSDIAAIMGLSPFQSPFGVFIDKTTPYENDLSENEAVYWGTVLEDVVAKEFSKRTGKKVSRFNAALASRDTPFAFANIDRRIAGEDAGLECKTTNAFSADLWKGNEVPAAYICQCQWYMYVTGAKSWYIACLIGGQHFVFKEIERDDEIIKHMLSAARSFWENNVLKNVPPAPDASRGCCEYIERKYLRDDGTSVRLPSDIAAAADELFKLGKKEKEIKTQKTTLQNIIKQYMEFSETGKTEKFIVSWKNVSAAPHFNREKAVKELGAEALASFFEPKTVRKFMIKEIK